MRGLWNTQLMWDDCQVQIMPIAVCFMIFGARMNILFIIKVKIVGVI